MSLRARTISLPLVVSLIMSAGSPARDLDVAVPPGSPLEWSASFPAYTPARNPLFPKTGPKEEPEPERSTAKLASSETDVRFANAFGQVRILTWDLGAHLEWTMKPLPAPNSGRSSLRPPPTRYGDPLYWLSLAPLLRLLLHPNSLSRSETLGHLVELGESTLPVLAAASGERELSIACRELRALIRVDQGPVPEAPKDSTPRDNALARFVLEECLRDHPLDPTDDFGRRLYLFAEEAEPLLRSYAEHPSLELARNAVSALGRYETRTALQFLATLAARADDPVTLIRALAGLGRFRGALDVGPLLDRLRRTEEPVQRAALIGALGRMGSRDAAPLLLQLGEEGRREKDSDLLIPVLAALANISWTRPQPELAAFCKRIDDESRELAPRVPNTTKPDVPDAPTLRSQILSQLALLARAKATPQDEKVWTEILALARPSPREARLSELGVGGTDPLGNIPARVRFLYLNGLPGAGSDGMHRLASLAHDPNLETALRGRALALLPYDQRTELAESFLGEANTPVELRIQALEVLIADLHPRIHELCRTQLSHPGLGVPRPAAGELFLTLRAVRFLSESAKLDARDLLPLLPFVQRPILEREAQVAELEARLGELLEASRGMDKREREKACGELFDFVLEHRLNALLDPGLRDGHIDLLSDILNSHKARATPEETKQRVRSLLALLLGGDVDWFSDPGRKLYQPLVPLAEEVLLALGRTRDPLALEPIFSALRGSARELRAHAALALGMCAQEGTAEKLLPALLDEDPFVRFCAAESLRHLTGKELALDWASAPLAERLAGAEELKLWFLEEKR